MGAKVCFMNDRASQASDSLVAKMLAVFDKAGLADVIRPRDTVAIKIHMGEWNNTAYLRPVYTRALVDKIKSLGGVPFVAETTTIPYWAYNARATALSYLLTAERNGFNSGTVGCPIVIADGYLGTDDVRVDLPEGVYLKEAYVATGIAAADAMIVLTHFKGHGAGVFGGAIKNLGAGCASKRGKFSLHASGDVRYGLAGARFLPHLCPGRECPNWQLCDSICAFDALHISESGIVWQRDKCRGCFAHQSVMNCGILSWPEDFGDINPIAMADHALGVVKTIGPDRIGYINLAIDVTPACGCCSYADRPIVPNVGVFASRDPVAIDAACRDAVEASLGMPDSVAEELGVAASGVPKFSACSSEGRNSEFLQLKTAEKIGLGTMEYDLEHVPRLESALPYVFNPGPGAPVPIGAELGPVMKRVSLFPKEGFHRSSNVDLEDLR